MGFLQFALVRITLCLIAGIVIAQYFELAPTYWLLICGVFLTAAFFWQRIKPKGISVGISVILCICAFSIGGLAKSSGTQIPENHFIRLLSDDESLTTLILSERLRTTSKGRRFVAEVTSFNGLPTQGKVLLHLPGATDYPIGTQMKITGSFLTHHNALNPGQFDYGKYLRDKKIYAKCYPNKITVLTVQSNIRQKADALRQHLTSTLRKSGFNEPELQVFSALMLGQQQDIDPDTLRNYQFAGAVHILSVSGLHVGFVMVLLQFLIKPIPKTRKGSILRLVLIVGALWGFALLAGLAPSVVRSATMFSIIAFGMHLRRANNSLHTLVASLFILLLIDPNYLFDVGFQLSYAALGFILWMQPLFDRLWTPSGKITKYVWGIMTVSIAAQLGTFPLSLYYFHQFPGLFLLTNLVVIPMVGAIMAIGLLVCLFALSGILLRPIVELSEFSIRMLNGIMQKIAKLDTFVFLDLPFHIVAVFAFYLMATVWLVWISKPNFRRLAMATSFTILLQLSWVFWRKHSATDAEMVVFQSKKPLIAIRQNNRLEWHGEVDSITQKNYERQFYRLKSKQKELKNLLTFGKSRVLILDSLAPLVPNAKPELLIVNSSPKTNPERVLKHYKPTLVILSRSNTSWHRNLWKRECIKQKIPFHNMYEKGSYKIEKQLFLP